MFFSKLSLPSLLIFFGLVAALDLLDPSVNGENDEKSCVCKRTDRDQNYVILHCSEFKKGNLSADDLLRPLETQCDTHGSNGPFSEQSPASVKEIHIVNNSRLETFDLMILSNFSGLEILNVSRNDNLTVIENWDKCENLSLNLKEVDFSFNRIVNTSRNFFFCNSNLTRLNLLGNPWNCNIMEWFIDWVRSPAGKDIQFLNKDELTCENSKNTSKRLTNIWDMIDSCPKNCSCELRYGKSMIVNCSSREWTDFPETFPNITFILFIGNNSITSLKRFVNGPAYRNINKLSIQDNQLTSLSDLESFNRNLLTLQVHGNRLTHLPGHILDQFQFQQITLGNNPWACDCPSGTYLRNFLKENFRIVSDLENVSCSPTDPYHPNKRVRNLSQLELCYVETSEFNILSLVNAFLALLILIALTKLAYDGWHFKKFGKLPLGPWAFFLQWMKERQDRKCGTPYSSERGSLTNGGVKI